MDSLMTLDNQFLTLLLLLATVTVLYIGVLIALTIFRFGLDGISAKNIIEITNSRTMRIFLVIHFTILLCFTVVNILDLDKWEKKQKDQKKHFEQFRQQIQELQQQLQDQRLKQQNQQNQQPQK